jgi:hypothetical protein
MFAIVQDVLFPILSYSQADEELWNTDPYEYIRVKFGKNVPCTLLCYSKILLSDKAGKECVPVHQFCQ